MSVNSHCHGGGKYLHIITMPYRYDDIITAISIIVYIHSILMLQGWVCFWKDVYESKLKGQRVELFCEEKKNTSLIKNGFLINTMYTNQHFISIFFLLYATTQDPGHSINLSSWCWCPVMWVSGRGSGLLANRVLQPRNKFTLTYASIVRSQSDF